MSETKTNTFISSIYENPPILEKCHVGHIVERDLLNTPPSTKKTYHLRLETKTPISYQPGDTIAVHPSNAPEDVQQILSLIKMPPETPIHDPRTGAPMWLGQFFTYRVNLLRAPKKLFNTEARDLFELFASHPYSLDLNSQLAPLLPRYYSIASAPQPHHIDLLVASFTHLHNDQPRPGLGSDFLCHRASETTPIPFELHPTKHFTLPDNPDTPIIMIGPGTGVAPFRSFLQQRPSSPNWLIFGERQKNHDFYYQDFFEHLEQNHNLVLDTAFSRDQEEKVYVQHRLLEKADTLWSWLENGAILYVCGDAKRMAKDVTQTLLEIFEKRTADPKTYLKNLRKDKRLRLDVY